MLDEIAELADVIRSEHTDIREQLIEDGSDMRNTLRMSDIRTIASQARFGFKSHALIDRSAGLCSLANLIALTLAGYLADAFISKLGSSLP